MKVTLLPMLELLAQVGAAAAKNEAFAGLFGLGVEELPEKDRPTARAALKDIQSGEDEGLVRFQSKLAEASAKR